MLTFDMRAFEQVARDMRAAQDQVPYAISQALNRAALNTQKRLASETWAQRTANRNKQFIRNALDVEFSDKRRLRVGIVDKLNRAHLDEHDKGGTVRGRGNLAIPTARVVRTGKGIRPSQKPLNFSRPVRKGNLLFQAVGRGKNAKLQLMYKLQPAYQIKPDVPFTVDFQRFMREEARREFPKAMAKAMRTRR
ncbi:hypothetical protein FV219_03120 [Methylobacterium sp. WL122]|nr:hypothetical protein FV219_03120 [Methylobacterium sp. WL122]